ncbi:spore coat protein [Metabacillus litoralis]|uniref:Spore coat protein n=1 Tax=Metabacillus litoralis TaxID=152268 RepID=A0A5C6W164_9BACI|nr:spore coat protein [Metabacillus litoralis]TXC90719.1 spore coat protein [Metabacillus litoralis]
MEARPYEWVALDRNSCHPTDCYSKDEVAAVGNNINFFNDDATVSQSADQINETDQISSETIIVRDSCDINVNSTDTQVAVSLQVALQVAIALVINLTIADSNRAEQVTQQLLQQTDTTQLNRQKLIIENSRDVNVTTTDTDVAISLQVLLQILIALVVNIDIF